MRQIKGLCIDWECGEGEVDLPDEFKRQSYLFQADVLQDWLGEIERLYNQAVRDWMAEMESLKVALEDTK